MSQTQGLLDHVSVVRLSLGLLAALIIRGLWIRHTRLSKIPGPALASLTNFWKWHLVYKSEFPWTNVALHAKYGPLVRIGPNTVSASSPEAIHAIYMHNKGYAKSDIYDIFNPHYNGQTLHNVFSTQDVHFHTALKRRIGALYTMTSIQSAEGNIDRVIQAFMTRLKGLASPTTPVDMSAWLQYYTFDAQGELNFSKPIGFIEAGEDVGGFCHIDHVMMTYFALWGQITQLEKLKTKLFSLFQGSGPNPLFEFTLNTINKRIEKPTEHKDFLSKLVAVHQQDPDQLSMRDVIAGVYINIVTGHDVTAIQLRNLVYYIAQNPDVYKKLQAELAEAEQKDQLSDPVQYTEAAALPYLSAIIQEALRIHPSAGLPLERIVPAGGVMLHDQFIPEGTIIGVNGWSINHDPKIFGADADSFRPERWIDNDSDTIYRMRKSLFTWGVGARSCIGKNMALLQLFKVAVELYRNFDIKLADPNTPWEVVGGWLTRQTKMDMILTARK